MAGDRRIHYLAFGSNLHPRRLEARVGPVDLLGVAKLPGWKLCFDKRGADGSAKANLRPVPGSSHVTWAAVYALPLRMLGALDRFEGCGGGYETIRFDVDVGFGPIATLAYLAPSHWTSDAMRPFDWYLELVLAGARFHRLPEAFLQHIGSQPTIPDPDVDRRDQRFRLLRRCQNDIRT